MKNNAEDNPLVSVMIPVYNGEKTLPLALASLVHQTYTNWKAIIVNDGSNDGTKEYLDSLTDSRFKIIHFEKNKGRPYARQAALDAAEGKYLAFLDADDFYHPEKLEKQVRLMEENPEVDLVSCGNASFDSGFNLITVRGKGENKIEHFNFGNNLKFALRTTIVKLEKARKIDFDFKLKHAQDTDFLFKYLNNRCYLATADVHYYYSEFVSVTGRKILKTYWYDFLRIKSTFKKHLLSIIISSIKIFLKFIFTFLLLPFLGAEYFLKKRGRAPSLKEQKEFNDSLKKAGF